jgi:hypothetical protein
MGDDDYGIGCACCPVHTLLTSDISVSSSPRQISSLSKLAVGFLVVSIPIETAYSWRLGLAEPYYLVKVVGWSLLLAGVTQVRVTRASLALALFAGGWGWFAANFWRAVADRFGRLGTGQALRLGSLELWSPAAACSFR